ncbi:phytanoyl-CoA dioxygenase family protein [Bradyrhizobium sp. CCH5-F6]|jgi:2-aminoethylphosphonate dioxygenase|uniref:phytanoyl-CoA dioxygenase family protein n=1 Tax=Bradyrhizobium sp. CCH5-F6 TaxID=1768753 RepID=UPI00076A7B19|nr:phytanoyl-CoA dioxygenase family protein [Bradyrhizobium sp. CCH5-F6]
MTIMLDLPTVPSEIDLVKSRGWALYETFLSPMETRLLEDDVRRLRNSVQPDCAYFYDVTADGSRRLARIERIWDSLSVVAQGPLGARIEELAASYFGERPALFKDKLNVRYPASSGYAPHQDAAAGWDEFSDSFFSVGLFLGQSDSEHGGFEVAANLDGSRYPNAAGKMPLDLFQSLNPLSVTANAGDALLLDGECPHRSFENRAATDSLHLLFTFVPSRHSHARAAYYEKKLASFADNLVGDGYEFRVFRF